ncbi:MAG: aminotransferase class V-fold PLP-dependent enzyme [Spirochaetales bacterium]|nr:aminotransferase class V-fold PLP-dependent enzyme [Spirochaetales bacterium]
MPEIVDEMKKYFLYEFGNAGSRTHEFGLRANQAVEDARNKVAAIVKCHSREVIFTSGATESNNLAILGLSEFGKDSNRTGIISSAIEHKSVLEPLVQLGKIEFKVYLSPVNSKGRVDLDYIANTISDKTLLVSIMQVNNETGVIQPIEEIAEILERYPEIYFHVDAAQGFGKSLIQLQHPRIDMISISGHKIYASMGIGALVVKKRANMKSPLKPLMYGGGQENALRPGTLPVPLIAGLGKAAEIALKNNEAWNVENQKIRNKLLSILYQVGYNINGDLDYIVPHVLNISFSGVDSEALFVALKGIAAWIEFFRKKEPFYTIILHLRLFYSIMVNWVIKIYSEKQ